MSGQSEPFSFKFLSFDKKRDQFHDMTPQNYDGFPAEEVLLSSQEDEDCNNSRFVHTDVVEISLAVSLVKGRLSSQETSMLLHEKGLADSDLIPGKYEGGFKLWECAVDLARFLCQHFGLQSFDQHAYPQLPGSPRVLELGCGQGLPGILLLNAGAEVHFQDYNREVLTALTAPNVAANTASREKSNSDLEASTSNRPRFFSGDWAGLPCLLEKEGLLGTYDIILSAETVYSLDSQRQLLRCVKQCLKPKVGQAWIAAKSYYFGVGGGTATFIRLVDQDGTFQVKVVDAIDDGASNKREILLLSFKTC